MADTQIEILPIVGSSNLSGAGYDSETKELRIEFAKSGAVYAYFDVPDTVYQGLLDAPSAGEYFDGFIRNGGFAYRRL